MVALTVYLLYLLLEDICLEGLLVLLEGVWLQYEVHVPQGNLLLVLEEKHFLQWLPLPVKGVEGIDSLFTWFYCRWLMSHDDDHESYSWLMSHDDDHEIHLWFIIFFDDSGIRTWFILDVWCITRHLIYLIYQFSFHIHVAICLFDAIVALNVSKVKKNEYFCIFLSLPIFCRFLRNVVF